MESSVERDGEETQEIHVEVTEEGLVWLHSQDWNLFLTPEDARVVGQALLDAAADADTAVE